MNFIVEPMSDKYNTEIIDIFNFYIENSFAAYFENKLPYQFFNKFIEMTKGYPAYAILSKETERVIGFCFLQPYSPLPVFKETAEVTYFIEKSETGKGIGKEVLDLLESEGKKLGIKYLLASISSHNEQSIRFHNKYGFTECGRFHNVGKKKSNNFDVVWMEKEII